MTTGPDAITVTYWTRDWTTYWTKTPYTARFDSRQAAEHAHEDVPNDIVFAAEIHEVTTTYRVGDEVTVYAIADHPQRARVVKLLSDSQVLVSITSDHDAAPRHRSVPIAVITPSGQGQ